MPRKPELRKSERVCELEPTFITIKNHAFRVNDISTEGVGIVIGPDAPRFHIGERLDSIPIPLESGPVTVKGVVSHISVSAAATLCGIMFLLDSEQFGLIARFQKERRRAVP
ncbi:MAG: hypothetical protein PVG78_04885 [Desulfobacterales bacterium]|jgi:hypothetical protein